MKILTITIALLLILNICEQTKAQNYDEKVYRDSIYKKDIRTLIIHKSGWELSYPIIHLNSDEALQIRFDDLSNEVKTYSYTVIHCNANWQSSGLFVSDYLDGFQENSINNYSHSFNTLIPYVHYHFELPNDDIRLTKSGNYVVRVFQDYSPDNIVLTACFSIVDQQIAIDADVKRASMPAYTYKYQEVDFTIKRGNCQIDDPYRDIIPVIAKNNNRDAQITGLTPKFVRDNELIYDYERENLFAAGNEYRHIDLKNIRFKERRTDSIYFSDSVYHFQIIPDYIRTDLSYNFKEDLNGKFLIKIDNSTQSYVDADYVAVHFVVPSNTPFKNASLYITGDFSNWLFMPRYQMKYNILRGAYELDLLLKQGYYNYQYRHVTNTGKIHVKIPENNHYQTENDYVIKVYHRSRQTRYDELIGVAIINSLKKM